jgi:hypothetical protein
MLLTGSLVGLLAAVLLAAVGLVLHLRAGGQVPKPALILFSMALLLGAAGLVVALVGIAID